jgi:hypothetical protein
VARIPIRASSDVDSDPHFKNRRMLVRVFKNSGSETAAPDSLHPNGSLSFQTPTSANFIFI